MTIVFESSYCNVYGTGYQLRYVYHNNDSGIAVEYITGTSNLISNLRSSQGKSRAKTGQKSVLPGSAPDCPVHSPASAGPAPESCSRRVSGAAPVQALDRPVYSPAPPARNRPPGVYPGAAGPKLASR
jgi:hypothetical protein